MAGTVYLRTNCFEVKLEGITFKAKDFESLCMMDFLFPKGKVWARPPVVGIDVMRHPRDSSILLVLLCFGIGCVILRFRSGEPLPPPIQSFLMDKRIRFVGFGVPEKKDLFPFEEFGLTKSNVDIGYLAAKILNDPKYKRWELAELARKVLGIKRMIGMTEASSFERHEQIKCAICQLFITSVIAMGLMRANEKNNKLEDSPKKSSFLKNLNSLPLLSEGWFKSPKGKKEHNESHVVNQVDIFKLYTGKSEDESPDNFSVKANCQESLFGNGLFYEEFQDTDACDDIHPKGKEDSCGDGHDHDLTQGTKDNRDSCTAYAKDKESLPCEDSSQEVVSTMRPIKGILKAPSLRRQPVDIPISPQSSGAQLRRANSKGCNVSFKID